MKCVMKNCECDIEGGMALGLIILIDLLGHRDMMLNVLPLCIVHGFCRLRFRGLRRVRGLHRVRARVQSMMDIFYISGQWRIVLAIHIEIRHTIQGEKEKIIVPSSWFLPSSTADAPTRLYIICRALNGFVTVLPDRRKCFLVWPGVLDYYYHACK